MTGILGKKIGMSRIINDNGQFVAVTYVQSLPNEILQVKTVETDGYSALLLGFDPYNKPTKTRKYKFRKEVQVEDSSSYKKGDFISLADLGDLDIVHITGITRGRGFQGTTKRYQASTLRKTHGTKYYRHGSTLTTAAGRGGGTKKGQRMPGHMGNEQQTLRYRKVVVVNTEKNIYAVKGSIPGAAQSYILLQKDS
ncbi:50S ribosomal protein L3 [Candidatus Peregrinibacteria bacterium]|nr:MAG: 50S ribosomal protein L3 [Candidatus Peregrinibacteria bacterium]